MAFTGHLAVITGGGSGMGQAWARQLANEGATVAILDVNSEGMADTASGFDSVHRFEIDITDSAAVSACLLYTSPSPRDRTRSRMPSSA